MISFIFPWKHSEERFILFDVILKNILDNMKVDFEICIHEAGDEPKLPDRIKDKCNYLFSPFQGIFSRAWMMNVGIKHICKGDMICMIDTDILLSKEWFEEVKNVKNYSAGFGRISYLDKKSTDYYITKGILPKKFGLQSKSGPRSSKIPKGPKGCGACTFIPRDLYLKVKGIPEIFDQTWGGEDVGFFRVMNYNGYSPTRMESPVYHLYHQFTTKINYEIKNISKQMRTWSRNDWNKYYKDVSIKGWGDKNKYEYSNNNI